MKPAPTDLSPVARFSITVAILIATAVVLAAGTAYLIERYDSAPHATRLLPTAVG